MIVFESQNPTVEKKRKAAPLGTCCTGTQQKKQKRNSVICYVENAVASQAEMPKFRAHQRAGGSKYCWGIENKSKAEDVSSRLVKFRVQSDYSVGSYTRFGPWVRNKA